MFGAQDSVLILSASVLLGLFATGLSASLSYVFTKRRQRETDERRLRREHYLKFVAATSANLVAGGTTKSLSAWSQSFNELQVVAVPEVLKAVQDYGFHCDPCSTGIGSPDWEREHNRLLARVLAAMRRDLFGKERGLDDALDRLVFRRPVAQRSVPAAAGEQPADA